ncbi:uromodulin-like [Pocillopora verrucosa]|uniref:uromodulin-like n=1 Tax=Pocillopora verrucosa TaxID=203993 RepID=UPI00333E9853
MVEQLISIFVLFTIAIYLVLSEDNCRILQFLDAKDGSALEKHVIGTIALNSEHSCRVQCYLENACVSYNFGKRVTGDEVCELKNSTDIQHPDDLKPRVNFIYRGAENSCGTTSFMNGGTRQSGFLPHGYRCLCAAGFTGLKCETDIDDCSANPCHNGGSCRDLVNGFKCDCPEGYLGTLCDTAPSECKQYKFLNDSDRHSDFGRGDRKCDKNLPEDWYRFSAGAGTSISTHCLTHHRCGTDMPGWMDGAHPTVDEGVVSRKVCFHGFNNCCHLNIIINVRNCSSFFVYRLKPVSICPSRYCGKS